MDNSYLLNDLELDQILFDNSISNIDTIDLPDFDLDLSNILPDNNINSSDFSKTNSELNSIHLNSYLESSDVSANFAEMHELTIPQLPQLREETSMDIRSFSLPTLRSTSDDEWDDFNEVNDPASGKSVPNEGHATEEEWDSFNEVNDPASGKSVPNEGHAIENGLDPASPKKN